jgi:dTDP-4-dehydrorhamnose 3,5-epimerase-like enzyme
MPKTINLSTFINPTGKISVIEKKINFKIKRVYFIYDIKGDRGGHKHKKNTQFIICLKGSCDLLIKNKKKKINKVFKLRKPNKGIKLFPDDWHKMININKNTILLVLASEYYNKNDYLENE